MIRRTDEWAFKWSFLALVAGVVMAICTATPDDGLRYWMQQFILESVR
jgi:hypothetical protein